MSVFKTRVFAHLRGLLPRKPPVGVLLKRGVALVSSHPIWRLQNPVAKGTLSTQFAKRPLWSCPRLQRLKLNMFQGDLGLQIGNCPPSSKRFNNVTVLFNPLYFGKPCLTLQSTNTQEVIVWRAGDNGLCCSAGFLDSGTRIPAEASEILDFSSEIAPRNRKSMRYSIAYSTIAMHHGIVLCLRSRDFRGPR